MEGKTPQSHAMALKKPIILLTTATLLLAGGLYSLSKAAPGFNVGMTTLSPFITIGYGRVDYGNMPRFKQSIQAASGSNTVNWKQVHTLNMADVFSASVGLQIGKYFTMSTGGTSKTTTHFKGTSEINGSSYVHQFTYATKYYQIAKFSLGFPLLSNNYYPFLSFSANYENLDAKYSETDFTNGTTFTGRGSANAVLPGIGLGLLASLPGTGNHLGMQFEYEYIWGKDASRLKNIGGVGYQLFDHFPHRNQFLISLRYTV